MVLRPWCESDAQAFYELVDANREHIRRWLPWVDGYTCLEDALAFTRRQVARWTQREDLAMGLFDRSGTLLGSIGLHPVDWRVPSFAIGYWVGAAYEGKGYVAEGVELVTSLALDALGAERVFITCDSRNRRSASVALRCGFVHEGTLRSEGRGTDGALRDTMYFARLPVRSAI